MRLLYKILLVVVILAALFIGFLNYEVRNDPETKVSDPLMLEYRGYDIREIVVRGNVYSVFVADTPELRIHGLSGKSVLPGWFGMEFVFENPGVYGFWMKDMKFPLDIIWVRDGMVVDVWEHAQPPMDANIPSYSPKGEADRVYEFRAGFVQENGLVVGESI